MTAMPVQAVDLSQFQCVRSEDAVKTDLELVCTRCLTVVCDVEPDDRLDVLARTVADHVCPPPESSYDSKSVAEIVHDFAVTRGDLGEQYARDQLVEIIERRIAGRRDPTFCRGCAGFTYAHTCPAGRAL